MKRAKVMVSALVPRTDSLIGAFKDFGNTESMRVDLEYRFYHKIGVKISDLKSEDRFWYYASDGNKYPFTVSQLMEAGYESVPKLLELETKIISVNLTNHR